MVYILQRESPVCYDSTELEPDYVAPTDSAISTLLLAVASVATL